MMRIVILAALPEEYKPFQRITSPWSSVKHEPFKVFARSMPEKELLLIETGMGRQPVQNAMQWAFEKKPADLVLSVGFAGSLTEEFQVGDLLWGRRLVLRESSSLSERTGSLVFTPSQTLLRFLHDHGVREAQIVTTAQPENKSGLSRLFRDPSSVTDMESYFVAQFAVAGRIPLLCVRAVSDAPGDEIDFDLDEITGPDGRVRITNVLQAVYREPRLIGSFYASWQRARRAAYPLGRVLASFVTLPVPVLKEMASGGDLRLIAGEEKACL